MSRGNPSADATQQSWQPKRLLCIYCQRGRHDQCVSHRTGFEFCICVWAGRLVKPALDTPHSIGVLEKPSPPMSQLESLLACDLDLATLSGDELHAALAARAAELDTDALASDEDALAGQGNIRTTWWPPRRGSRDGGRSARPAGMSTEAIRGAFCAAAVRMSARTPPAGSPPRRHGRWWPTDAGGTRDPCSDR